MSRGFYSDIEEIRQENTQYAVFHINNTPELLESYMQVKNMKYNNKSNTILGLTMAKEWASTHNNEFGDLFETELELVRWNKVLKLL